MFTATKPVDSTALERQNRRIRKLKAEGVNRTTIFVHEDCRPLLDELRPFLIDSKQSAGLSTALEEFRAASSPINVAQVKQLSPFRYPGGKTWLVPEIRNRLRASRTIPEVFVEPFAGGAMIGLTTAAERLAEGVVLSELDPDVASVWQTIFDGTELDVAWLCQKIRTFEVNLENVQRIISDSPTSRRDRAFKTIVKNRMQRGGIMAAGAGLVKVGEAGRGLFSRWYPETLTDRIRALREIRTRVTFECCDAFQVIQQFANNPRAFFFIDPPYTAGGKKAGSRLYTHSHVDHNRLFREMSEVKGSVTMTYDDTPEVRELASKHGFRTETINMKSTHHAVMQELLITKP